MFASPPVARITAEPVCWSSYEKSCYTIYNLSSYRLIMPHVPSVSSPRISAVTDRLHKLDYPRSCSQPYLRKLCNRLVQISDSLRATSWKTASICNCLASYFEHISPHAVTERLHKLYYPRSILKVTDNTS